MSLSSLLSGTLDTTPNLLLQLDSHLSSQGRLMDIENIQRQSGQNKEQTDIAKSIGA